MLFVSPRFLFPADSGGKIRTRDVLRGMKGGRFEITLASPETAEARRRFADELASVCDRFVGWVETDSRFSRRLRRSLALISPLPVAVASDRSSVGSRAVAAELVRDYDIVVVDFPHAAVLMPPHVRQASVLFTHNIEAEIFRRHAEVATNPMLRTVWSGQADKMERFEHDAARRFDGLVAVSERDSRHFASVIGAERVFGIPTGVDLGYFGYAPSGRNIAPDDGTVVFTGSMNWRANVDGIRFFMDSIWPRIVAVRPRARMIVVGHSPPRELVEAARARGYQWVFTGFVDDVRVHVNNADVYVIPLRVGGGTRIKAFEAMAMGCPVVSTSLGVEGLPVVDGRHCVIADTDAKFAEAVLTLLGDSSRRRVLAHDARALMDARYSYQAAAAAFEDACLRTIDAVGLKAA